MRRHEVVGGPTTALPDKRTGVHLWDIASRSFTPPSPRRDVERSSNLASGGQAETGSRHHLARLLRSATRSRARLTRRCGIASRMLASHSPFTILKRPNNFQNAPKAKRRRDCFFENICRKLLHLKVFENYVVCKHQCVSTGSSQHKGTALPSEKRTASQREIRYCFAQDSFASQAANLEGEDACPLKSRLWWRLPSCLEAPRSPLHRATPTRTEETRLRGTLPRMAEIRFREMPRPIAPRGAIGIIGIPMLGIIWTTGKMDGGRPPPATTTSRLDKELIIPTAPAVITIALIGGACRT